MSSTMSSQAVPCAETGESLLLKLPIEIRLQIYRMVLPFPNVYWRGSVWANVIGDPKDYMGLLRVNKQVSDEAREILYSLPALGIIASYRPSKQVDHSEYGRSSQVSIKLTKHLTLCIGWYAQPLIRGYTSYIKTLILAGSAKHSKIPDRQRLQINVGCLHYTPSTNSRELLNAVRTPFQELRIAYDFMFTSAGPWNPSVDLPDPYKEGLDANGLPSRPLGNLYQLSSKRKEMVPRCRRHKVPIHKVLDGFDNTEDELKSLTDTRCQEPACLTFAESFVTIKDILEANISPNMVAW